jgi:signal transduction histidine kinase
MPTATTARSSRWVRLLAQVAALCGIYYAAARFGLWFATVGKSVTLIWPPAGISIAALALVGLDLWPGVALGAFMVNLLTPGVPVGSALGMAAGNTLEAIVGAYLLRRTGFSPRFERISDVVRFVVLAAIPSTCVAATIGSLSLRAGGVIPSAMIGQAWRQWWLGDLMGDLLVAPLLLTYRVVRFSAGRRGFLAEACLLLTLLLVVGFLAFGDSTINPASGYPQTHILFPLLIWAALRFGILGAVTANLVIVAMATWGTLHGSGPFTGSSMTQDLYFLNTFMMVVIVSSLLLSAAVAERNRAVQIRDDFLSIASHELRTPLAAMRIRLELLKRGARGKAIEVTDAAATTYATLDRQSRRLTNLVEDLFDVTRIGADRLTLDQKPIDLCEVVRIASEDFTDQLAKVGFNVETQGGPAMVGHWDQMRLVQVISNLLANSIKYGEGRPVFVEISREDRIARVVVGDNGIGIDKREQSRVFDRFERAASARGYGGLGLGLYIARRIVEAHQGVIRVESDLGRGSRFIVELPFH